MSVQEIMVRSRQLVDRRLDQGRHFLGLGFGDDDFPDTRPGSNGCFFFAPTEVPVIVAELKRRMPVEVRAILERADRVCDHCFDLLGYKTLDMGEEIDWQLDVVHSVRAQRKPWFQIHYLDFREVGDSKITWELNRHQHLVTLAKAYRISGDEKYSRELFHQWYHWQQQNPYPLGINWVSSLEVAFRSIAWLWVWYLLVGTPALPPGFRKDLLRALAISGRHMERYLSTYFSANTHLLGEGVGLFFIGLLCREIPAANRWCQLGWKILLEQAQQQVLADGMHFEQSTYYHVYALDFFLHAYLLARRNEQVVPEILADTIRRMLEALDGLAQAGPPPRFGDDDGGRLFDPQRNRAEHLTDPLATGAVLYHRTDFKRSERKLPEESFWLLGSHAGAQYDGLPSVRSAPRSRAFANSGHYVMAEDKPIAQLTIDAGPQGASSAGHGHADALSIQLNIGGLEFVTDAGTFEYIGDGPERDLLRSTGSHSTLQVDRSSQVAPDGPFSWKSLPQVRPESWILGPSFNLFVGSHDGYAQAGLVVTHRRSIFHLKSQFWLVRDLALGEGTHDLDQIWHLAVKDVQQDGHSFGLSVGARALTILACAEEGTHPAIFEEPWSPAYGTLEMRPTLHLRKRGPLPAEIATLLVPAQMNAGHLERLPEAPGVEAYRYSRDEQAHYFIFSRGGAWSALSWSSDAEFLYFVEDRRRTMRQAFAVNCGLLEWNRQVLVSRRQPWEWMECHGEGKATNIVTPEGIVAGRSSVGLTGEDKVRTG